VFEVRSPLDNESEAYGYAKWLAKHLKVREQKTATGFQHGWIWWDIEKTLLPEGLDPNWNKWQSMLVQDEKVAEGVRLLGKPAIACGLPFLNYFEYGKTVYKRDKGLLFIPSHSNSSAKITDQIYESIKAAKDKYSGAVLLAYEDRELEPAIKDWFAVEIGAGDLETNSFERLSRIFQQYSVAVTDTIGSHVLYARWAGMPLGVDAQLAKDQKLEEADSLYPGLVIDGNDPVLWALPEIAVCEPREIAKHFGWEI
jgi:hypothetical protein